MVLIKEKFTEKKDLNVKWLEEGRMMVKKVNSNFLDVPAIERFRHLICDKQQQRKQCVLDESNITIANFYIRIY